MRAFALASLFLIPAAAAAQPAPPTVEITLSSFDFSPQTIRLAAGRPVVLHLVNSGRGGHNFSAPQFFAAASGVTGPVREGTVEVAGRESVDLTLTPARGTYPLKCTHTLHAAFGMRGQIIVE